MGKAPVISYRFRDAGIVRHVDNVRFAGPLLLGFELRRGGRFSQRVKRYRLDRIGEAERIELERRRPYVPTLDRFAR